MLKCLLQEGLDGEWSMKDMAIKDLSSWIKYRNTPKDVAQPFI